MKIAVLGSGAMGGLYSSYLSRHNEVTVIDVNAALVEKVNAEGLEVQEPDGTSNVFHPHAVLSTEGMEPVDLIIVFVKAMFSEGALNNNKGIIGPDTYIMTLQDLVGQLLGTDDALGHDDDEVLFAGDYRKRRNREQRGFGRRGFGK